MKLFSSFRMRLLLIFAALLVTTLGVQYYLNLRAERNSARMRERQEQALNAGFALGVKSISTKDRLIELRDHAVTSQPLLDEHTGRVSDIFVIDDKWRVYDSLDPQYLPDLGADGSYKYLYLWDLKTLPPLTDSKQFTDTRIPFPQSQTNTVGESHMSEVITERGPWYLIVVLKSDREPKSAWNRQAARPLVYTLAVLLVATSIASLLVWRFTQPIQDLSRAARRVAAGDFNFRVPAEERNDEMGELARVFNEMIANLGRTRELEAQLHQAERSAVVGRLASAIAHEIRNPLNYINLTLDHLRTAFAPEDAAQRETFSRLATQLKAEVARINRHISDFLNYSRPPKLELQPLDLRAAAEDALRMVEVQASESNIKLEVKAEAEMPHVLADPDAMRSVFTNLIINGVQAIDGAGGELTVEISADKPNGRACIDIKDTGPGIPPENISKLFEPYFSTKETGTGLGLAIVKKAVEDHGGTITVKSKEGSGTTFTITLPIAGKDKR